MFQLKTAPDNFMCPITYEIMDDPVITTAGQTYEHIAIKKWFEKNPTNPRDPITNQVLQSTVLIKNWCLKKLIVDWKEMKPTQKQSKQKYKLEKRHNLKRKTQIVSKKDLRCWCRKKYGVEWFNHHEKSSRLALALKTLSK